MFHYVIPILAADNSPRITDHETLFQQEMSRGRSGDSTRVTISLLFSCHSPLYHIWRRNVSEFSLEQMPER